MGEVGGVDAILFEIFFLSCFFLRSKDFLDFCVGQAD